ncbi:MAG: hypothetical protein FWH04_09795 [Oscillospiraceae bacterium]|nr:hypothetical protein [Oscillospiraceae bacterium]
MAKAKGKNRAAENEAEVRFEKRVLLNSERYKKQRDLLAALLEDGQEYTLAQADAQIQKFMKGMK